MPTWKDITNNEEFQSLSPQEQSVKKIQFYNDVVKKSPKFLSLDSIQQTKLFENMFPDNEYPKTASVETIKGLWNEWKNLPVVKEGDRFVDFISDKVKGEVKPEGNHLTQFPRFLAGEFIKGFEPSSAIPFVGGAKVAGSVLKPVGKYIFEHIPENIKKVLLKELTVGKGQPVAYQEMAKKADLERLAGNEEASKVATTLSTNPETGKTLPLDQQKYIGRIFRKEVIESPELKSHPKYAELKSISDEGRSIMDKWSNELSKSGIPSKETREVIENNIGNYMARMYTSKLEKSGTGMSAKILRLRLNGLKNRKDLSESVLRQLGEIKEPALPTAIRVKEISSSIANNKLFNQVAKNQEWVSDVNLNGKMVQMPDTNTMGALKGKWVIPEIGEDLNAIIKTKEAMFPLYNKMLSAWKYGKVVLNPATHARNIFSNSILLDLSGTNHIDQARLLPKIMSDYANKGELYQLAKRSGAIGGEWVGTEVQKLKDVYIKTNGSNMHKMAEWLKMPFNKLGNIYQAEEQIAKMVKFAHVLEKGGTPELAANEAQKWLFDYNKIPNFMNVVKQISPFATFTYKSIPRVGEALVNNPMRVYKYYNLFKSFNEASRELQGMSPEEYVRTQKALPPWYFKSIGSMPLTLMMPWKDKNNNTQWFNLEYSLPLGITPEILKGGVLKGAVSNPLITLFADLDKNQDFKGQPIIPVGSNGMDATKSVIEYVYRQLAPSFTLPIGNIKGGYSFEKIHDSITQHPDYANRIREIPTVLLDTLLGMKITPVDVNQSEFYSAMNKQKKLIDMRSQVIRLYRPDVKESIREEGVKRIFENMQRVLKE